MSEIKIFFSQKIAQMDQHEYEQNRKEILDKMSKRLIK